VTTIVGVALGVAVSTAMQTANGEVLRSFEEAVLTVAGRATLQVSGGELGLDERVITVLRDHPDVLAALPVIQQQVLVANGPHRGEPLVVMGLDLLEVATHYQVRLTTGPNEQPTLDPLLDPEAVFLGAGLAADWSLSPGSELELLVGARKRRVVVRGVVESIQGLRTAWDHLAVMDIAAAQLLFGLVGRLDRIDLVTNPARPVSEVAEALRLLLPTALTIQRPAMRNEQVERMVRAFQLNLTLLSGVSLIVGLLLVYNTVAYSVVRHRCEIGILRAVGLGRSGVAALVVSEAAIMGFIGGMGGSVLGVVLADYLVSMLSRAVSDLYVSVHVRASGLSWLTPTRALAGGVFGLAVAMLGGLVPCLDACRTVPARALAPGEYEAVQEVRAGALGVAGGLCLVLAGLLARLGPVGDLPVFGYGAALCLLVGVSCQGPLLITTMGRLAVGAGRGSGPGSGVIRLIAAQQVRQAPGRNGVTVASLVVGLAIVLGVGIMIESFRQTVEEWINQTVMADLIITPPGWLTGEGGTQAKRMPVAWADLVARVPGVEAVDPYRDLTLNLGGREVSLVARDLRVHAERSRYLFLSGDSRELLTRTVETRGIIISEVLANRLGLREGYDLRLLTPVGERSFPVIGIFYDYATDGGKVVMDRSLYRALWNDDTATVIAIYLAPGADTATVRRQLSDMLRDVAQVLVITNAEIKREIMAIFDRTFLITYALEVIALVIALLSIVNTLLTTVLERQQELATFRAVGASAGQIRQLVLWEGLYLGVLGTVLGVVAGALLSILLIAVINKQSFGWTIRFQVPVWLIVKSVLLTLGAALAASYFPAGWAARQPVADGLRYE
jgi:putative ABC transport system permease protein